MLSKKGFTLVELIVVLLVVSILGAVAIPRFMYARYKACASEFPTVLSQMYVAEGVAHANTGTYQNVSNTEELANKLNMEITESKYFTYSVKEATDTSFTAIAEVKLDFGGVKVSDQATINARGVKSFSEGTVLYKYAATWEND